MLQVMFSYKEKDYYEDEDALVRLEEVDEQLFVHVKLLKASKEIMENLLKVWSEIKAKAYWDGYEAIYTYTNDDRMLEFFPFGKVLVEIEYKGKKMRVVEWALN